MYMYIFYVYCCDFKYIIGLRMIGLFLDVICIGLQKERKIGNSKYNRIYLGMVCCVGWFFFYL